MSLSRSACSANDIISYGKSLGATAVGIAGMSPVDDRTMTVYDSWIAGGNHGEMSYMARYRDVRHNPENLLPGAKSIVIAAFNYYPRELRDERMPRFAYYAYGRDYHEVVRERLERLAGYIREHCGGETRVCVDTAPIFEHYWARRSGLGFTGVNSLLIIPGTGSYVVLGEIITTATLDTTEPCTGDCGNCGACVRACPTGAIKGDGTIDATRCLSYLTIEYRGELPDGIPAGNRIYGCDTCQQVCPHNRHAGPTDIEDFAPSAEFLKLDEEAIAALTPEKFNALFRHSAVKRTKLKGLIRNLELLRKIKF